MKSIKIVSEDPYTEIANIIDEWCRKNYYGSFVVTISIDGQIITEYLEFDGSSITFIWENDWWEGEKEIYLLGFMPMLQLRVYGAPGNYINYDKIRSMSAEELAEYLAERSVAPSCTGKCHKDYEVYGEQRTFCHNCWLDWLKEEATDGNSR
jgi:hypothetical protein